MDFFQRIARLIDSALDDDSVVADTSTRDTDYHEAWQELDDYLTGAEAHYRGERRPTPEAGLPPEVLQAYRDLEVSPYSSLEEVKDAYRRLQIRYHPDRFGMNPQKQKLATEIAIRLNDSYSRIRDYLGS